MATAKYDLSLYASGIGPELLDNGDAKQLTFADAHGNPLALMLKLEAHRILELTPQDRTDLAAIYKAGADLTPDQYIQFDKILSTAKLNSHSFECLCLIGDVMGDRGKSDLLTLLVLKKLTEAKFITIIEKSNHDMEFIKWFLSKTKGLDPEVGAILERPFIQMDQRSSLNHLIFFVESNPDQQEFIKDLIDKVYSSRLQLLNYSIDSTSQPPKIQWFTHAPAGLEVLKPFADYFGIAYDGLSLQKQLEMIDQINRCYFKELTLNPQRLALQLAKETLLLQATDITDIDPKRTPFFYLTWNRGGTYLQGVRNGVNIHGHLGAVTTPWNEELHGTRGINLDENNRLGFSMPAYEYQYPFGLPSDTLGTWLSPTSIILKQP